jgi:hypothetical protein
MDRIIDDVRAFAAWAAAGSDVGAEPGERILRDLVKFAMVATAFPLTGWVFGGALMVALWAKELRGDLAEAEAEDASRDILWAAAGACAGALALVGAGSWTAVAPLGWSGLALWASGAVVAFLAWRDRGRPE